MYLRMDAFEAYKAYLALKSHFNNKTYDFFKYNGRTRASKNTFEKRTDKYFFHKLAKRDDVIPFLVSNFLITDCWVGDLVNEQIAEKTYREWKKRQDSLSYIFSNDIEKLDDDFNSNFMVVDGAHPKILKMYLRKEVTPETLLILEDILGFFRLWNRRIEEKYIWPVEHIKLKKYRPFFTINPEKYKKILVDKIKDISYHK